MLALARANAVAEIHERVPEVRYHTAEELLAAPEVRPGAIPEGPAPVPPPGLVRRVRLAVGKPFGTAVTMGFGGLIQAWGRVAGYRDEVWTNWYRRRLSLGILTLAYMREHLNAHNLRSTYPRRSLTGFQQPGADAAARRAALPHGRRDRGTTSATRWRAPPARASRATSPTPPSAPRRARA